MYGRAPTFRTDKKKNKNNYSTSCQITTIKIINSPFYLIYHWITKQLYHSHCCGKLWVRFSKFIFMYLGLLSMNVCFYLKLVSQNRSIYTTWYNLRVIFSDNTQFNYLSLIASSIYDDNTIAYQFFWGKFMNILTEFQKRRRFLDSSI